MDGSDGANFNSNPALSTKTGDQGELSVAQKKSSLQVNKNGPKINVDEQIETGTTNIQIKDGDFKQEFKRPQTRGDAAGKAATHSMNSSRAALRGRRGLHQKQMSTQLAPTSDNPFNLKSKNPSKGANEAGNPKNLRAGGRGSKSKASGINEKSKDYGVPIHVPRKFAPKHARVTSFNSTGKGFRDRDEDLPGSIGQFQPQIYDKA
jgi:hypothetical protein